MTDRSPHQPSSWRPGVLAPLLLALCLAAPGFAQPPGDEQAQYTVRFESVWSAATHPIDFPNSAHFSRLVGGTHNGDLSLWSTGSLASRGIQDMAEIGAVRPLRNEVNQGIQIGDAGMIVEGDNLPSSPGVAFASFTATRDFPLITLVAMVAPSPDWFIGTSGLSLLEGGEWVERKVVQLFAYDAGTDSGPTFRSPNQPTAPPEPITRLTTGPFANGMPLGTFTFDRTDGAEPEPVSLNGGRFEVRVRWEKPDGTRGFGQPDNLTDDTGYFWFFDPENVELVIKVLDACPFANRYWVFASGLTDVGVEIEVHDPVTQTTRTYSNPVDRPFELVRDIRAFGGCS